MIILQRGIRVVQNDQQRSKNSGLAVGGAVDEDKLVGLRGPEKLIQWDVMMDGTHAEETWVTMTRLRLAQGSHGEACAVLVAASGRLVLRERL